MQLSTKNKGKPKKERKEKSQLHLPQYSNITWCDYTCFDLILNELCHLFVLAFVGWAEENGGERKNRDMSDIMGEENIESILSVEMGLRELASLKVILQTLIVILHAFVFAVI